MEIMRCDKCGRDDKSAAKITTTCAYPWKFNPVSVDLCLPCGESIGLVGTDPDGEMTNLEKLTELVALVVSEEVEARLDERLDA